jgi:large repetitive protein
MKNKIYITLVFLIVSLFTKYNALAQCSGSLGDPVVRINFGATATNPGAALGGGITNYTFTTTACPPDGSYTVRNQTNGCFSSSWHSLVEDHTAGDVNGQMMIVNAANTAGEFYKQTISGLCPGTGYELSAYVINLLRSTACTSNANRFPKLTFQVETTAGAILGTFNTPQVPTINGTANIAPSQWSRYALFFTSTASTVVLKIINNAPGGCGNDLALDDIEFRACGPTLSAAISGSTNVCGGQPINLTSSISAGYVNPVYQWQSSNDNINFNNIAGATNTTFTQTPSIGTTYYRLLSSENGNIGNTNCRVASNVTNVVVFAIPNAPVGSGAEYCQNASPSLLNATGSGTINWYGTNASGGTSASSQTPSTATIGTTNYYVSSTVNGCESSRTAVPVTVNPLPLISATVGNISCNGLATGTIVSNASGGTPGYTFSKDGVNYLAGSVFNGIAAGTYTIYVKDSKNCLGTTSITLAASNPLTLSTAVENTCTPGNNGKVTATGTGGISPLEFNIDGGVFSATNVFTGLTAGSHTVKMRDSSTPIKCEIESIVTVPSVINPTVTIAATSLCITGSTGTISATPNNGTLALQYALNGAAYQNGNNFTNLAAGTYTVTVKDNRGCTSVSTPVIISNIPPVPTVVTPVPFCINALPTPLVANGASILWYTTAIGGVGSSTQPVINTGIAGSQTYYASQTLNGCESGRNSLTVNISPAISISLTKIDACNSLSNGSISAVVSGGVSPFTFSINSGAQVPTSFFNNLAAGSYNVAVLDANNCSATATIIVANGPALSVTGTIASDCIEVGAGSINPVGAGGTGAYSYKLNSGAYTTTIPFTGLNAGTYTICVKDAQGCLGLTRVTIKPKPFVVATSNSPTCGNATTPIIALEGLEAGTGAIYSWSGPNGFTSALQNPTLPFVKSSGATEGIYTLTVDLDGCIASNTVNVTCASSPLPVKLVSFGANQIENHIMTNWVISEAIGFDKFELEKSNNVLNFENIHNVAVIKLGKETQSFNFKDVNPLEGINYYRLKMIDLDGTISFSKIVGVNFEKDGEYVSIVNPIENNEIILITNINSAEVFLYTILGQPIKFSSIKTNRGFVLKGNFNAQPIFLVSVKGQKAERTIRVFSK